MIVLVNDRGFEGNVRFRCHFAVVVDSQTFAICSIDRKRLTIRIEHATTFEATHPFIRGDIREVGHETVEYGPPGTRRQMQGRGGNAVARGWLVRWMGRHVIARSASAPSYPRTARGQPCGQGVR